MTEVSIDAGQCALFWKKRSIPGYRAPRCRASLHYRGHSVLARKALESAAISIDGGKAAQLLEKLIA
jgi:hypothetical protein